MRAINWLLPSSTDMHAYNDRPHDTRTHSKYHNDPFRLTKSIPSPSSHGPVLMHVTAPTAYYVLQFAANQDLDLCLTRHKGAFPMLTTSTGRAFTSSRWARRATCSTDRSSVTFRCSPLNIASILSFSLAFSASWKSSCRQQTRSSIGHQGRSAQKLRCSWWACAR